MEAQVAAQLLATGVIPVIVIDDANRAGGLATALIAGNLPIAEVTLRTANALPAIEALAQHPELLVGAGTVVTARQVAQAASAGAKFVVSPGLDLEVLARARECGLFALPAAVTPTEIMAAVKAGCELLKFFPAGAFGGPATLKALHSPFSSIRFVPTGGIGAGNMSEYLKLPNVAAVGGSWMVPPSAIAAGEFDQIRELSRTAVTVAQALRDLKEQP